MSDDIETPAQRAIRAVTDNPAFRDEVKQLFIKGDVMRTTGVGFDEVEEWLFDDAADFLAPDDGEKLTEGDIRDFVEDTMDSMAATAMPDLLKDKGKAAADAGRACIAGLTEPVTGVFLKYFKAA